MFLFIQEAFLNSSLRKNYADFVFPRAAHKVVSIGFPQKREQTAHLSDFPASPFVLPFSTALLNTMSFSDD